MELLPIEGSSNVAAIGYLPDVCLLRVKYRDGSMYDHLNVSQEAYEGLLAAPSKGKHLAAFFTNGVRSLADGGEIKVREPYIVGETPSEQHAAIETFGEDPCCSPRLMKGPRSGDRWLCPKCGCEWHARMIGAAKVWEPHDAVMVW